MSFESEIQQWVSLDNQLKKINETTKDLRQKKNILETSIIEKANTSNLQNATVKISDGRLRFVNTKTPEPLTFKYLEKSLTEIIKNEEQVKQIINYIKEKRETKEVPEIKRFYNN